MHTAQVCPCSTSATLVQPAPLPTHSCWRLGVLLWHTHPTHTHTDTLLTHTHVHTHALQGMEDPSQG